MTKPTDKATQVRLARKIADKYVKADGRKVGGKPRPEMADDMDLAEIERQRQHDDDRMSEKRAALARALRAIKTRLPKAEKSQWLLSEWKLIEDTLRRDYGITRL